PYVGIFRFVPELGRKFGIAGVNPRNVTWQKRIITVPIDRERPEKNLEQPSHVARPRASHSAHYAVACSGGVAFLLVNLADRDRNLRAAKKEIRQAASEFAGWPVIVRRWVLDVGDCVARETAGNERDEKQFFHEPLPF